MSMIHDYILIGSGAAGGVLAHRLSEDPAIRVLLLEAGGPDDDPAIPRVDVLSLLQIWKPELDWGFSTEPEPGLLGRRIPILQGRVLGGGTSINARIYLRGNRKDYDHWNHLGNEGWSYEEVLPYFRRSEDYPGGPSRYHGAVERGAGGTGRVALESQRGEAAGGREVERPLHPAAPALRRAPSRPPGRRRPAAGP